MKIEVVYVCPANAGDQFIAYAWRFLESYHSNPPGMDHGTIIICNGSSPSNSVYALFKTMPDCKFFLHDNSGYDIGAFQHVSKSVHCDMMVFLGSSAYVQGEGWLERMAEAFKTNPDCQFGSMGNTGNLRINVYPHIRTTGFWMRPSLFSSYPMLVNRPDQRYPFEHGKYCFTQWLKRRGIASYVVTWSGKFEMPNCNQDPNGFHRGDQSSLLCGDRLAEPPFYPERLACLRQ